MIKKIQDSFSDNIPNSRPKMLKKIKEAYRQDLEI